MSSGAPSPEEINELIKNLTNLENANLTAMAILALLVYDWLICFEQERRHFWTAKWTFGTILYFLNRFIPTASNFIHITTTVVSWSPEVQGRMCAPTLRTLGVFSAISFTIVQVIMSLRTYALYDCNKMLLSGLLFLSLASFINQMYWLLLPHATDLVNTLPAPYNGCLLISSSSVPQPTWAKFIPLLVFEGVLLALTFYKFLYYLRSGTTALVPKVLFRDGFVGFFAVIAATVFGCIILIERPHALLTLGQIVAPIIPVLVASHMLLNLRDVMKISGSSYRTSSGSGTHTWTTGTQMAGAGSGRERPGSIISPWLSVPPGSSPNTPGSKGRPTSGQVQMGLGALPMEWSTSGASGSSKPSQRQQGQHPEWATRRVTPSSRAPPGWDPYAYGADALLDDDYERDAYDGYGRDYIYDGADTPLPEDAIELAEREPRRSRSSGRAGPEPDPEQGRATPALTDVSVAPAAAPLGVTELVDVPSQPHPELHLRRPPDTASENSGSVLVIE